MKIQHDQDKRRFFVEVSGQQAELDYAIEPAGSMVLFHTFTPKSLRGEGIASALVTAALEFARADGRTVVPSCSFVKKFVELHPEYATLLS